MIINKRVVTSVLTIGAAGAMLVGATFALFSDTATVTGISVSSGNADLKVFDGDSFEDTWNTGLNLTGLYPGYSDSAVLQLKNDSTSNISLDVNAQLTAATGWPNALIDAVEVRVQSGGDDTNWRTLRNWNASAIDLGGPIAPGATKAYTVSVRVPPVYTIDPAGSLNAGDPVGNEIQNLSLTDIVFTLTGTQVP